MTTYGLYGLPEPELPKRPPSPWRWPVRIVIGVGVALCITMFLLSRQGGNSDSLKDLLEQHLAESSGYDAEIGTLNAMSFFPVLGADFNDLVLRNPGDGHVVARLGHVNFSVGFLKASIGRSAIRTFSISDAEIEAGLIAPEKIVVDKFFIDFEQLDAPVLRLNGVYGEQKLAASADLERQTSWLGASSFILAEDKKLLLESGPVRLDSVIGTGKKGERTFTILSLETGPENRPLKGLVEISRGLNKVILKGNVRSAASHIDYALDVANEDGARTVKGTVTAPALDLGDMFGKGGMMDAYHALSSFYRGRQPAPGRIGFISPALDLDVRVDKMTYGTDNLGTVQSPVKTADNTLHIGPLAGTIGPGKLAGDVLIDARTSPATQTVALQILEAGKSGLRLELAAQGDTFPALWNGLNGQMSLISSGDTLSAPLQTLWNGRLAEALLPETLRGKTSPFRCLLGDFSIENGRVTVKSLLLDLPDFAVSGKGWAGQGKIDVTLSPVASAGPGVHLSGALDAPLMTSSAPGKGLLPDDLVPAFGLEALGLDGSHPCKDYLKP